MNFQNTHTSLPITIADEYEHAWLKVEDELRLALEARWILGQEQEHTQIDAEEEARLVEEARLKSEEEEYTRLEAEEEARLVEKLN